MQKHVLIFDSGVGGLSVYREIRHLLPHLRYSYLFDNARFPYGELPAAELVARCCDLIVQRVACEPVDLVVIACNTASTQVLPTLRARLGHIPVVGVVPAIKPAAAMSQNRCIGLLATPATVARPYTDKLIHEFAADCTVLRLGSTELVIQAEHKLAGGAVDQPLINTILAPWREAAVVPDVIVLGCTHFPLLSEELNQAVPGAQLIDSGRAIARRVASLLNERASDMAERGAGQAWCTRMDEHAQRLQTVLAGWGLPGLREQP